MESKKLALYYGVEKEVIGVRECLHDWKEGDIIVTDGAKTEIYAVFESTMGNMMEMAKLFTKLNTKTAMWCLQHFNENPHDEDDELDNEDLLDFTDLIDLVSVMVCNQYTVKKRMWPDYEKRLDLMEDYADRLILKDERYA